MKFKETLKDELKYQDIKVKELSEMTGIPKGTIDHYLAEKNTLPLADSAVKIAQALGVTTEYLVTGQDTTKEGSHKNPKVAAIVRNLEIIPDEDLVLIQALVERFVCTRKK